MNEKKAKSEQKPQNIHLKQSYGELIAPCDEVHVGVEQMYIRTTTTIKNETK